MAQIAIDSLVISKEHRKKEKKKKPTTICVFLSYSYFVGVGEVERGEIQTSLGKKA